VWQVIEEGEKFTDVVFPPEREWKRASESFEQTELWFDKIMPDVNLGNWHFRTVVNALVARNLLEKTFITKKKN
jgi:hypothetical protein